MAASVPELPITDHRARAAIAGLAVSEFGGICALEDFGALRFRGPDAQRFLQGQLSNDMTRLAAGSILRAGLHNPQGRTLAVLWLAMRSPDDILAWLPSELAVPVATQLRRYVLRSKLAITQEPQQPQLYGIWAQGLPGAWREFWAFDASRWLALQPAGDDPPPGERMTRTQWRALDIAAGMPQVYAPTSGQFVAQMLNLDCIDAVSFEKGCYTGQEVIARAHYRGRVKRRMQRFESLEPCLLRVGDAGRFEDGRAFRVVEAVQRADGSSEFLAVAPLPGAREAEESSAGAHAQALRARALALPYALPT
jgi:tRNA-modifying protein YgfZ